MTHAVSASKLRELQASLSGAHDRKIARAVALLDALPERGAADSLIAPLRPRLAQLRPARPLRLPRLMFLPLDPLIVPAPAWRPDDLTIPRTALQPLAECVQNALNPSAGAKLSALTANRTTADSEAIGAAGALLWPMASKILQQVPPCPSWPTTGLPPSVLPVLAKAVGQALAQGVALHAAGEAARGKRALENAEIAAVLQRAAAHGPEAVSRMLLLLLSSAQHPGAVLRLASGSGEFNGRKIAERAAGVLLDLFDAKSDASGPLGACHLSEAGDTARRIAELLDGITANASSGERRQHVKDIRDRLDASCRDRFAAGLDMELLSPLKAANDLTTSAEITALESAARDLRRLEMAGRRIGGAQVYDKLLGQTTAEIRNGEAGEALPLADRVRLVEILAGPDEALTMLNPASPARRGVGR